MIQEHLLGLSLDNMQHVVFVTLERNFTNKV